jgi:hypothetical protein
VKYGALFGGLGSTNSNVTANNNLGAGYARVGYSFGNPIAWPNYTSANIKVFITYNTAVSVVGNYTPLPTDTVAFKARMDSVLTAGGLNNVLGVHIINEVNNIRHGLGYWNTTAKNMINLLRAGANMVHSKGLLAL